MMLALYTERLYEQIELARMRGEDNQKHVSNVLGADTWDKIPGASPEEKLKASRHRRVRINLPAAGLRVLVQELHAERAEALAIVGQTECDVVKTEIKLMLLARVGVKAAGVEAKVDWIYDRARQLQATERGKRRLKWELYVMKAWTTFVLASEEAADGRDNDHIRYRSEFETLRKEIYRMMSLRNLKAVISREVI